MSENSKNWPLMEIIVLTLVRSDNPIENIPQIKVIKQGNTYGIIEGSEIIQRALAEGFENLDHEYQASLLFAVELEKIDDSKSDFSGN